MSTPEENKALVRRFFEEVLNQGNIALVDELFAPGYEVRSGPGAGAPPGPGAARLAAIELRTGVPYAHYTIEDLIAEGDRVVVRRVMQGTHSGTFQGIPATGKRVRVPCIDIYRLAADKIAERRTISDQLGLRQQLGVIGTKSSTQGEQ